MLSKAEVIAVETDMGQAIAVRNRDAPFCWPTGAGTVEELSARIASAGLRGIGVSFVNYLEELPYFRDEVLPRLERMGLREARG